MAINFTAKHPFYATVIVGVLLINGCSSSAKNSPVTGVGSTGPGGGIVFDTFDEANTTGLEVFPSDIGESSWGCEGVVVDAGIAGRSSNGLNVPAGSETSDVIRIANSSGICLAGAAQLTFEFTNNNFTDWYLPSTDELIMIRDQGLLPGDPGNPYWSSTEDSAENAFTVLIQSPSNPLDNGDPSTSDKALIANVIAIRRFQR